MSTRAERNLASINEPTEQARASHEEFELPPEITVDWSSERHVQSMLPLQLQTGRQITCVAPLRLK